MTSVLTSHSTVLTLQSVVDFRRDVVLQQLKANPNPVANPYCTLQRVAQLPITMRLRRFTVCGLQNSPENRYCNVIIFVFTDMLLAVSGMYQLEKKEEGIHPRLRRPNEDPLRNRQLK